MHGKGVYTWSDGKTYKGYFENDKKNGKGKLQYPDGRVFKGYWEDGK